MDVVIIGTGNVAETLGILIKNAGHNLVQVYGRMPENAHRLAEKFGCSTTSNISEIAKDAQCYLIAISDSAIATWHQHWHTKKGLVLHTAGSVPMDVLKQVSNNYGVMYPLQSLRAPHLPTAAIPLLVNANTPDDLALITDFARTISPVVHQCSDEDRLHFHLAAVLVSNFTNHLYQLAADFCAHHALNFHLLYPLILETAKRMDHAAPADVQTGPAIRNDAETIAKHLFLLNNNPSLAALYQNLSESILHSKKIHDGQF